MTLSSVDCPDVLSLLTPQFSENTSLFFPTLLGRERALSSRLSSVQTRGDGGVA